MGDQTFRMRKGWVTLIAPYTSFTVDASAHPVHFFTHAIVGYPYTLLRGNIFQFKASDSEMLFVHEVIEGLPAATGSDVVHAGPHRYLSGIQLVAGCIQKVEDDQLRYPDARIAQLDAFMRENISRRFTNDDLADMVGMSTTGFIRFFREKTGVTPARYFYEIRTEQITNLLENTKWSIEKIAESCGFADRYHMSKVFKRTTGSSPAAWRKAAHETQFWV